MNRLDRVFLVASLAVSLLVLAAIVLPQPEPEIPPTATWTRSSDRAPPAETPIIGFWIDRGQPIPCVVVAYGEMFFEYNPTSRYPAPLFGYPPVYWIGMPGGAE